MLFPVSLLVFSSWHSMDLKLRPLPCSKHTAKNVYAVGMSRAHTFTDPAGTAFAHSRMPNAHDSCDALIRYHVDTHTHAHTMMPLLFFVGSQTSRHVMCLACALVGLCFRSACTKGPRWVRLTVPEAAQVSLFLRRRNEGPMMLLMLYLWGSYPRGRSKCMLSDAPEASI